MEILLCQSCASILRGNAKYCTGCGAFISRFSPTSVSTDSRNTSPLTVSVAPDPLVMEKAITRRQVEKYNVGSRGKGGNGKRTGAGSFLQSEPSFAGEDDRTAPPDSKSNDESRSASSILGSVLNSVSTARSPFPKASGVDAANLISFDMEQPPPVLEPSPLPPEQPSQPPSLEPSPLWSEQPSQSSQSQPPSAHRPPPPAEPWRPTEAEPAPRPTAQSIQTPTALPEPAPVASPQEPLFNPSAGGATPAPPHNNGFNPPDASTNPPASTDYHSAEGAQQVASQVGTAVPQGPTAQSVAIQNDQTIPIDLFLGEVISHPPGSYKPRTQQKAQSQDADGFDPAPVKPQASTAGLTPGPDIASANQPATGAGSTFPFGETIPHSLQANTQHVDVPSAVSPASGAPLDTGDFFSSGAPSVATSSERISTRTVQPDLSEESHEHDRGKQSRSNSPGSRKDSSGSTLRERTSGDSDLSSGKSGAPSQGFDFAQGLGGSLNLLGISLPKKHALIAAVILIFVGFQAFPYLQGMLSNAPGGQIHLPRDSATTGTQSPSLSGTWESTYQSATDQTLHPGQMQLNQKGSYLSGEGQDDASFTLEGTFDPPSITLSKQYMVKGQPKGRPVQLTGTVDVSKTEGTAIDGTYLAFVPKQGLTTTHWEEVRGRWQAQPMASLTKPVPPPPPPPPPPTPNKTDWPALFTQAAIGLIILGVLIVLASLKLFGPAGSHPRPGSSRSD